MQPFAKLAGAIALAAVFAAPAAASEVEWLDNYEEAKKLAKEQDKFILADFTGSDWCGWCIKLKNEVFQTPEFKSWADKNVVLLELDFPRKKQLSQSIKEQNEALRDKHKVRGYPTIVFMDPSGEEVGRTGYQRGGPAAWTKSADGILATGRDYLALKNKQNPTPAEKAKLLETELEMGKVGFAEAKERRAALEGLSPEQAAKLDAELVNLEVMDILDRAPNEPPAGADVKAWQQEQRVALGKQFHAMLQQGRTPTGDEAYQPFYILIMDYSVEAKDPASFEAALGKMRERFGENPSAAGFFTMQEERLAKLKGE